MEIRQGQPGQLNSIFAIFMNCKLAMDAAGIFQWTEVYPNRAVIESDIDKGELYCLSENGCCMGVVALSDVQDPEYATVNWHFNEGKILVVHRLAIDPLYQGRGYARKLMDFAEAFAREHGYASIRLDAYSKNPRALQVYELRDYIKRGEVYFSGREFVFYCYEKRINRIV